MDKQDNVIDSIIFDLNQISCIMEDDEVYTQQKTEQFKVNITTYNNIIKVNISHVRWEDSKLSEWITFVNFTKSTSLFKEYYQKVKEIVKKYEFRTYLPKDKLEIRIIEK